MTTINTKLFREALGAFPTGVAVVTTRDNKGKPVGLTMNSFASVSLDPPLVLWSVDENSDFFDEFCNADHYAVHVLQEGSQDTSTHFTKAGNDQFDNIDYENGISGLPLLSTYTVRFQSKVAHRYEGGDHVILVGRVLDMAHSPAMPLVFHAGKYSKLG